MLVTYMSVCWELGTLIVLFCIAADIDISVDFIVKINVAAIMLKNFIWIVRIKDESFLCIIF